MNISLIWLSGLVASFSHVISLIGYGQILPDIVIITLVKVGS